MLNFSQTIISQYANSATISQLIANMNDYIDPRKNLLQFYNTIWNVDTAVGFGLDIWGRIVGVSRVIPIPGSSGSFGFANPDFPPDWQNFGNVSNPSAGGPFFAGQKNTGGFALNDDAYRVLILTKALANIVATNAPSLNQLVQNLFPGRGRCYTRDGGKSNASAGGMSMVYVFEFKLTSIEFAILSFSGVLPHPAGVRVSVVVVLTGYFGFRESGPRQHGFRETGETGAFYTSGIAPPLNTATAVTLSGVLSGTSVALSWTASTVAGSSIAGYQIWRSVNGSPFSILATTTTALTYTDSGLTGGDTYEYYVIARPTYGNPSPASNTITETP